ncbi:MAG: rod-binding protein [Pseudomonadota bacterium]
MSSDFVSAPLGSPLGVRGLQISEAPRVPPAGAAANDAELRALAQKFEAMFLAEMLKHTGLDDPAAGLGGGFDGGHGEDAFKSLLVREYADGLSRQGRLGLAERIYADLKQKVAPHAE